MKMEDILGTNHIYCLCLKDSKREPITRENIINAGFSSLKMLYGVNSKDLTLKQIQSYTTPNAFRTISYKRTRTNQEDLHNIGAVACGLGHRYFWELVVRNRWKRAILFEDDALFSKNFKQDVMSNIMHDLETIDPKWEVFSFGDRRDRFQPRIRGSKYLYKCRGMFYGAMGYMVTINGAMKLLKNSLPFDLHIDAYIGVMCDPLRDDPLRLYFSNESLVLQDLSMSSQIGYSIKDCNIKLLFPDELVIQFIYIFVVLVFIYLIYRWGKRCGMKKLKKKLINK